MLTLLLTNLFFTEFSSSSLQPYVWSQCDDIKLHPAVIKYARKQLLFTPKAGLFASAEQLQIPRYYSPFENLSSADTETFSFDWNAEPAPSTVTDRKISPQNQRGSCQSNGGCSTMEIRPLVVSLCPKSVTLDDDIYLKDEGTHWSNPIGAQLSLSSRPSDISVTSNCKICNNLEQCFVILIRYHVFLLLHCFILPLLSISLTCRTGHQIISRQILQF